MRATICCACTGRQRDAGACRGGRFALRRAASRAWRLAPHARRAPTTDRRGTRGGAASRARRAPAKIATLRGVFAVRGPALAFMPPAVSQESLLIPVSGRLQLHLRRIWSPQVNGAGPVLMLHGAAEDGRIFYSYAGRGLACFLARNGYEVFVPDMRGKGKSWPGINQHSDFGFHELITVDIPLLAQEVRRRTDARAQTWITHSLGGPVAAATIARAGAAALGVNQLVHFGARRQVSTRGWQRRLLVDLLWHRVGRLAVAFEGYLPAPAIGLGTARESSRCFRDGIDWSIGEQWLDSSDGFDYGGALRNGPWLRSLYFASATDRAFGSPEDVRDFMHELGPHDGRLLVLGLARGNLQDYSHTGMLLHPDAEQDHFSQLLAWLRERDPGGA